MKKSRLQELAGIAKPTLSEGYAWEREENGTLPTLASSTAKHAAENFKVKGSLDMKELQDRSVEIKFDKSGIGYLWTDKFGKEKYEEGSFADAKSFDEILKRISEEILYQEENSK
jgi:hypothetical protein